MLEVKNIKVELGGSNILNDVSLSVAAGELLSVVGPNGAGKSTLFSVMSGAFKPQAGSAFLEGRAMADWPAEALARRRAVLPQHSELTFPFRVLEVVLLGRSPHAGFSDQGKDLTIARLALLETETLHLVDRVYTTLSGGERQRVQLARVLTQIEFSDSDVKGRQVEQAVKETGGRFLLLDEPTSSLDPSHQHATLQAAVRACGRGIGVVAVLHDLNLAAMYADRIVMLKEGKVVAQGKPVEVLTEGLIETVFELPVSVMAHPRRGCPFVVAA
ncbi:heme ABC transporter ATP-binding protein [Pelagibius sp. Alg239-R121]|uniref:heme ABC transporter ATP-binding protein n=1 Tax=Pelagibius sp. Alg239-R121 TaxID=2993448 RepID=UPI0024A77B01|nr:heme ABC transporter ATP-binding protein [Pelagibius sp. Alg239-R121]